MAIELTAAQHAVLEETKPCSTPAEFETLLQAAQAEMPRVIREEMGPEQPVTVTVTELRDLYLAASENTAALEAVNYDQARRTLFRDAIRLLDTAQLWFGEGSRAGVYRPPTVEETVQSSRPWRERLGAYAAQAFVFEPEIAELLADVNSSGTLEEEIEDLRMLVQESTLHRDRLIEVGASEAFLNQGGALLKAAETRDLLGILGLRNKDEALSLRNRILTYATQLGREARAAGVNGCFDQPEARKRFEAASFRQALRRLRAPRRRKVGADAPLEPQGGTPGGTTA